MIKRHCMSLLPTVLIMALFLFMFTSCGIPTYFYYDDDDIFTEVTQTDTSCEIEVSLDSDAYAEYVSMDSTPSVKLFYILTTEPLQATWPLEEGSSSSMSSAFKSLYKGSGGNGTAWSNLSGSSAEGWFIYVKEGASSLSYSIDDPDLDGYDESLVVGTFSQSETEDGTYVFGTFPSYDFDIDLADFTSNGTSYDTTFSFEFDNSGEETSLKILTPDDEYYLKDFRKNAFIGNTGDLSEYIGELHDYYDDGEFYDYLTVSDTNSLYLHIWAAMSGGEGDFNNIFWSTLNEITTIKLY